MLLSWSAALTDKRAEKAEKAVPAVPAVPAVMPQRDVMTLLLEIRGRAERAATAVLAALAVKADCLLFIMREYRKELLT
jgi:hypothetical protein